MKKLNVIYNGFGEYIHYGLLAETNQGLYFEFTAEALKSNIQLSPIKTPLSLGVFQGFSRDQDYLPGFIADALPDGWGRLLMDRLLLKEFNIHSHNVTSLQRLSLIGDRAIGALCFTPSENLEENSSAMDLYNLAQAVQQVISNKDTDALLQLISIGGSPQGARPKAMVRYNQTTSHISTDPKAIGEDWLIKFPAQQEHQEVCAIEKVYSELARNIGIDIPPTKYFKLDKKLSAFGIKRFDRTDDGQKIPLLTVAGALDLNFRIPNFDYKELLRLTRAITHNIQEIYAMYLRCVFNIIFNNRDDHTKNFSFIMDRNLQWHVSPCYDLTFNRGPNGYHQMSIMGEAKDPTRNDLIKLAKDSGLDIKKCDDLIGRVADAALTFKQQALNQGEIRKQTIGDIDKVIKNNLKHM